MHSRAQAVCVTHENTISSSSSSSSESIITFPVEINRPATPHDDSYYNSEDENADMPVFSVENAALDTSMAMRSVLNCPVEYISKEPPLLALENYCFVIDGDLINVEKLMGHTKCWWKPTSSNVHYYFSPEMKTFYQVNALLCRGELRCAYMRRRRAGGMEQVPRDNLFRVSRIYSHWKTCLNFHRIISDISPVTEVGVELYGFRQRIFVQYLWRTEKKAEKKRVAQEYKEYKASKTVMPSALKNRRPSMPNNPLPITLGQRRQTIYQTLDVDRRSSLAKLKSATSLFNRRYSIAQITVPDEKSSSSRRPSYIPRIRKPSTRSASKTSLAKETYQPGNRRISLAPQPDNRRISLASQPDNRRISLAPQPGNRRISLAPQPDNRRISLASQPDNRRISLAPQPDNRRISLASQPDNRRISPATNNKEQTTTTATKVPEPNSSEDRRRYHSSIPRPPDSEVKSRRRFSRTPKIKPFPANVGQKRVCLADLREQFEKNRQKLHVKEEKLSKVT